MPTLEGSAENMPPGNFVKITPFEIESEGPFCSCRHKLKYTKLIKINVLSACLAYQCNYMVGYSCNYITLIVINTIINVLYHDLV